MTESSMRLTILFFVKFPEPGKVKTRLAATLGSETAASIYRRLVEAVCEKIPADADVIVTFDPAERENEIKQWLAPLLPRSQFSAQYDGDLGARLMHAFAEAFNQGAERVAAIGSDCVEISPKTFSATWSALESHDAVIGPANDGGYYLIALKRPCPELFRAIPWSTEQTFTVTMKQARAANLSVFLLPMLRDVDGEEDWQSAQAHLSSRRIVNPET